MNESLGDPLIRAENEVVTSKPSKPEQVRTCVGKWNIFKYTCLLDFFLWRNLLTTFLLPRKVVFGVLPTFPNRL